ncbi:hypothetical protein [Mesorhizobium sp. M1227]
MLKQNPEEPERVSALLASLQSIGAEIRVPREQPFDAIALLDDQD